MVIVAASAASCSNGSDEASGPEPASVGRVAVDASRLQPPGTPLGPGAEVQAGSYLVGEALPVVEFYPQPGVAPGPLGWQAVLIVDGDPIEVWNRYVEHLGLADERATAHGSCLVKVTRTPTAEELAADSNAGQPIERFITEPPLEGENLIECYAAAEGVTMALAVGTLPCLSFQPSEPPCRAHAVSHLYVSVTEDSLNEAFVQLGADQLRFERAQTPADPDNVVEPLPVPSGPAVPPSLEGGGESRLPEEGERLDDNLDYFLDRWPVGLVPRGARSLVAPAMLIDCNSGLVALLEVAGSPVEAVRLFREAAGSGEAGAAPVTGDDSQGRAWAGGEISSAGGYDIDLVALDTGGGKSAVLFTECGD